MSGQPRRGDVYWVALDPAVGTEIRKTQPAVIVSNDSCNTHGTRVVVVPVTSNVDSLFPGEARVHIQRKPARVLGDQIRSIDKTRLRARIASLQPGRASRRRGGGAHHAGAEDLRSRFLSCSHSCAYNARR